MRLPSQGQTEQPAPMPNHHLFQPVLGLEVRVVPGPDGPHGGRLIARVGLGGVLEV